MRTSFSATFFYSALTLLFLASCRKDNSNIGLGLIDDQLGVVYTENIYIQSHTIREDSLSTFNRSSTSLGSYEDVIFGKVTASVFSQFLLSTNNPPFNDATCDSVVLSLSFKGFYGRLDPQHFRVYTLNEQMYKDTLYYSIDSLSVNTANMIGNALITPNPFDSLFINGDSVAPQLRIPLSTSFGDYILNASSNDLANNTNFAAYLKGLFITASPFSGTGRKSGGILYFNWGDANTKITIYYHSKFGTHGNLERESYDLVINSQAASFNHFRHDYSTRPSIASQLSQNDTVNTDYVFIQGLSGLKAKFRLPSLQSLKDSGNIAINKAELILRVDPLTLDNDYQTPTRLALVALDSTGKQQILTDYLEGENYFGGTWDAAKKEYRFNIGRHLQDLLNGEKTDYGMVLVPSGGAVNANRVVLGGGGPASPYKMRLKIAYTKLN